MTAGVAVAPALSADPQLPQRDLLLDSHAVAARLSRLLAVDGPIAIDRCTRVRAKYRIGESLRVVYRLTVDGEPHLVSARTFLSDGSSSNAFRNAVEVAVPTGRLHPVVHDSELDTVWWTVPNDRRLRNLADLVIPTADLRLLAARAGDWASSEVVELAPERSVTVRASDPEGSVVAYAKGYAPGSRQPSELAALYDHVAHALAARSSAVASPRSLGWDEDRLVLLLEPMRGTRWADVPLRGLPTALRLLGEGIAQLHTIDPPSGLGPFTRVATARLSHSIALVSAARPDLAPVLRPISDQLTNGPPEQDEPVLLHGDCHPKNALVHAGRVALIDLDQAGVGPAAADIGSLLAKLRHSEVLGELGSMRTADLATAFLDGYASVRALPTASSLRWHTTAAFVAERAMRAVNRVNQAALARLDELLRVAQNSLEPGARS